MIRKADLKLLESRIPDTKRYNREISPTQNGIFRSTLFPPDNRQEKGSGLSGLVEEICRIAGLNESDAV